MPPVAILIKPASSNCNLRCHYCFYLSEAGQRKTASYGLMSAETLTAIVQKGLDFAEDSCTFAFQGGEPTLAGLPFYRKLIELEQKYNKRRVTIGHAIQTNGLLLNQEWVRFFSEQHFLVGLSLDGDSETHNLNRVGPDGSGSFNRVLKAARLLQHWQVDFNILTVVTSHSARRARRIYDFYKKNGFRYLQFIPCLDPLFEPPGKRPYSLTSPELERFLKELFDRWYSDYQRGDYVSVRYFDNLVQMLLGFPPEACSMKGVCSANCVLEADGSVYPCDFYMLDAWRLGNIRADGLAEMLGGRTAQAFVAASGLPVPGCSDCQWQSLCRGGCRRERTGTAADWQTGQTACQNPSQGQGQSADQGAKLALKPCRDWDCEQAVQAEGLGVNRFCQAYKGFFDYAYPRLIKVARTLAGQQTG